MSLLYIFRGEIVEQRDNYTTAISLGKRDGRCAESVNRDYSQIATCKRPVVRFGIAI